mgnify:CR=1 FL=1
MPAMQLIQTTAKEWGLSHVVCEVLRPSGSECTSEQTACCRNACSDCAAKRRAEQGRDFGVRQPDVDETPLSASEKAIAERFFQL